MVSRNRIFLLFTVLSLLDLVQMHWHLGSKMVCFYLIYSSRKLNISCIKQLITGLLFRMNNLAQVCYILFINDQLFATCSLHNK